MRSSLCSLATGLLLLVSPPAGAQVADFLVPAGSGGAVEVSKPFFDELDFGSGSFSLRGSFFAEINARTSFVGSVPLVYARYEGTTSTTLGNPEVGLAFRTDDDLPLGSVSVALPLTKEFGDDDFATGVGMLSDYLHADRYVSDVFSVNGMLTPSTELDGGGIAGFKVGASTWIPKGDTGGDVEVLARYGAFISHATATVRLTAELNGVALVSEGDLSVSERTMHEAGLSVGPASGRVLPEIFVRVPLDEGLRQVVDASVGLRVRF